MKLLLILLTFSSLSFSLTLEEQIDQLTPQEHQRIMSKLMAKPYQSVLSEGFFTRMTFSMTGAIQWTDLDKLYAYLNPKHAASDEANKTSYANFSLLWKTDGNLRYGLGIGGIYLRHNEEISTNVFEEVKLNSGFVHLQLAYNFRLGKKWAILPTLGGGVTGAYVRIINSNDNTSITHQTRFNGYGFSTNGSLALNYYFNSVLALGLEGGYHYAKIDKVKRSMLKDMTNPSEIDLSGEFAGLRFSYNL